VLKFARGIFLARPCHSVSGFSNKAKEFQLLDWG
jgi:hypothetical protein